MIRIRILVPVLLLSAGCYQTMRPVQFAPERIDSVAACVEETIHYDGYEMRQVPRSDGILAWVGVRRQLAANGLYDYESVGASIRPSSAGGPAELHASADGETQPKLPEIDPNGGSASRMRADITAWRILDCAKQAKGARQGSSGASERKGA